MSSAKEKKLAVENALKTTQAAADEVLKNTKEKARLDKDKAVELAVKKAMEEAARREDEEES